MGQICRVKPTFIEGTGHLLGGLGGQLELQVVAAQELGGTGDGHIHQTTSTLIGVLGQLGEDILLTQGLSGAGNGTGRVSEILWRRKL